MQPIMLAATLGQWLDTTLYAFDMWVYRIFGGIVDSPLGDFFTEFAKFITSFGDSDFVEPMVVVGIVLMLFKRTRKYGIALLFSIIIGTLITNVALKPLALRVRPYNTLQGVAEYFGWYKAVGAFAESDYSFPSGHTTAAFEMAIGLFLCFKADKRKIGYILPVLAIGTMGSRIYLMVHYPTDVLGGVLAGTVAGILGYFVAKGIVALLDKKGLNDKLDLERIFKKLTKKDINGKIASVLIFVVVAGFFTYSWVNLLNEEKVEPVRCAYADEAYDCQNFARVDDEDYPAIDGENFCKIHWKQLNGIEE